MIVATKHKHPDPKEENKAINLDFIVTTWKWEYWNNGVVSAYIAFTFTNGEGLNWKYSSIENRDEDYDKIVNIL